MPEWLAREDFLAGYVRGRPLARTLILSVGLGLSAPVQAVCDGCVVAAINEHRLEMVRQFQQLREWFAAEIKTVRQALAQTTKDALRARLDMEFILPTGRCETATAAAAAGPARDRTEAYLRAFNHLPRPEKNATAAAVAMHAAQVADYCSPEDTGSHGCTQAGTRPDAQFLLETLLSGSGVGDHTDSSRPNSFLPEVLSFDEGRVQDARRYIENAVNPYPLDEPPRELRETPQGKAYWIRKKLYEGRLSVARYSLNQALALRVPAADLRGWLAQVWQQSKAGEHLPALEAQLPAQISYAELLKTEVDRRYASANWYAGIAGSPEPAVLRELAYMQALALNLDYLRWRQGERTELLLAQLLSETVAAGSRRPLQEEYAAAVNLVKVNPGDATADDAARSRQPPPR